jgi:hypothetical protein
VLRQRISETITVIQPGRVTAIAKIVEGLTRDVRMVSGHGLNDNADATKQRITLQKDFCRELTFEHNREFDKIACGYTATRGAG